MKPEIYKWVLLGHNFWLFLITTVLQYCVCGCHLEAPVCAMRLTHPDGLCKMMNLNDVSIAHQASICALPKYT